MPIADDLQTIVADLSAAIAGRKNYGRVELERLRRQITTAARTARRDETDSIVTRTIADDVLGAIDAGVLNLAGVAKHARERLGDA